MPIQSPIVMQQFCINLSFLIMFFWKLGNILNLKLFIKLLMLPKCWTCKLGSD